MAQTDEAREEPLTETFDGLVHRLTGSDSPTGTTVDVQMTSPFAVGGPFIAFLHGAQTGTSTYAAGEQIGDDLAVTAIGIDVAGSRLARVHNINIIDPGFALDVVASVPNFRLCLSGGGGSDGTPLAPSYLPAAAALAASPLPITWTKWDTSEARYLFGAIDDLVLPVTGPSIGMALVAEATITTGFATDDAGLGQGAVAAIVELL